MDQEDLVALLIASLPPVTAYAEARLEARAVYALPTLLVNVASAASRLASRVATALPMQVTFTTGRVLVAVEVACKCPNPPKMPISPAAASVAPAFIEVRKFIGIILSAGIGPNRSQYSHLLSLWGRELLIRNYALVWIIKTFMPSEELSVRITACS